jgi:hypothetical protein
MRDTRIEEQLRDVLRAEADTVPLTLSAAELELRLRLRRSQRANQRILLGAAAALAIAVGVGGAVLLSNRNGNQSVATSPSPSAPVIAPTTSPSSAPSPTPSASAAVGFDQLPSKAALVQAAQAQYPDFVLAVDGDWNGAEDTETYEPGTISTGSVGTVPVTTEYVLASACSGLGTFDVSIGPRDFERRLAGGTNEQCDPAAAVTYFSDIHLDTDVPLRVETHADPHASWRVVVLVRPSALPDPPTTHEPSVTCKTPGRNLPEVTLSVNGGAPEVGEVGTTAWMGSASDSAGHVIPTHVIHAKVGDDLRMRIGGDVCASAWSITYGADVTKPGEPGDIEPVLLFVPAQENPDQALDFAAENRFRSGAVEGDWIVHAALTFPDGDAQVYWHLIVEP